MGKKILVDVFLLLVIADVIVMQQTESQTCNSCCQGPIGPQGAPGVPGIPGSHGTNGISGGIGQKGEPGSGNRGEIGQKGDPGVRGQPGEKGERGEVGIRGSAGKVGPIGPQGPVGVGNPGPRGIQGAKGEPGVQGRPAVSRRSAFTAIKTAIQTTSNSGDVVTFQQLVTDVGGDFDLSSGKFTCSIAGVYFFMFSLNTDNSPADNFVAIVKNGDILVSQINDKQHRDDHLSTGTVVSLVPGDQVWVKLMVYSGQEIEHHSMGSSSFTGYLMYED